MIVRYTIAAVFLVSCCVPAAYAAEVEHSARNYHLVFHTRLSGQSEDFGMVVSEGEFGITTSDPSIEISGRLDVSEDFMYRLEYRFEHQLSKVDGKGGKFYRRMGKVILEPGKTIEVVRSPSVELGIELKKVE